jgi:hypothetical protein
MDQGGCKMQKRKRCRNEDCGELFTPCPQVPNSQHNDTDPFTSFDTDPLQKVCNYFHKIWGNSLHYLDIIFLYALKVIEFKAIKLFRVFWQGFCFFCY